MEIANVPFDLTGPLQIVRICGIRVVFTKNKLKCRRALANTIFGVVRPERMRCARPCIKHSASDSSSSISGQ